MGTEVHLGKMKKILEMGGGDDHAPLGMYLMPFNCPFQK